jgi:predicted nucleic acid-binding protein
MIVVADASVALKWIFHDAAGETDVSAALSLLDGVRQGSVELLQPEHWIIEIAQAVVLKTPERAKTVMADFQTLPFGLIHSWDILSEAMELSARLKHHLFDAIYHAIALEHNAVFITADDRYFAKAFPLGNIKMLTTFSAP